MLILQLKMCNQGLEFWIKFGWSSQHFVNGFIYLQISWRVKLLLLLSNMILKGLGNEGEVCTYLMGDQILTCNSDMQNINLANQIQEGTTVVMIKNSDGIKYTNESHRCTKFRQITTYQISGNDDMEIDEGGFDGLSNLQNLKLNDNMLRVLKNNVFVGLIQLKKLELINCGIEKLEDNAFHGLNHLETLDLSNNHIKVISNHIFKNLRTLTSLSLYHNNVHNLGNECFKGTINLRDIDFTYNKIKHIDTNTFNELPNLSYLYLSNNEITTVVGDFTCPKLKFLYLSKNKLKEISETMFEKSQNLIDIDLSFNNIIYVSSKAFFYLNELKYLNYRNNNITDQVQLKFQNSNPLILS